MSYLPLPPLGLPPLSTLPTTTSKNANRISPGSGILPAPRRPRTPSTGHHHHPAFPPLPPFEGLSSSSSTTGRFGALSVPPLPRMNANPSSSSSMTTFENTITPRTTACLPCKKGHLKCGRGMRPCNQCIRRGKSPEECLQGIPDDQAKLFLRLYREKQSRELNMNSTFRALTPVFDDDPLFPMSTSSPTSSSLGQTSQLTYPPLGQMDDNLLSTASDHVTLIMSQDFKIGRASQEALRTFGYHSHEMCNQSLPYYLPITEREKWKNFSMKLFSPLNPPGNGLPVTPAELARLPFAGLTVPVKDMRSIVGHYHFRHHSKEMVSVRIGLWFSSYFGATTSDFSTFRNALIVAKISPIDLQGLPSVMSPPTSSSTSSSATFQPLSASLSTFPSVLLPAPGHSSSEAFAIPRRSRTPSLASADGGAKFSLSSPIQPLPPLQSFGGSSSSSINLPPLPPLSNPSTTLPPFGALGTLPPLGALPPLGTFPSYASPPRKRPPSTAIPTSSGTPFHHLNTFDHGSGLNSSYNGQHLTSKPRLRSPTPHSGHRRSMSSEAGHSNYSTASSSTSSSFDHSGNIGPFAPLDAFPPIQRPQSRNRRTSQLNDMTSAFDTNGSSIIPHIPKLLPDSPSKLDFFRNSTGGSFHHNNNQYNPYHNIHHSPYKPRKQSYIAIDDSFNSPPSSSPSASGNSHHDKFRSTSLDFGHFPFVSFQEEQEDNWLPLSSLPSSFAALSLDSPNSGNSPTESQY